MNLKYNVEEEDEQLCLSTPPTVSYNTTQSIEQGMIYKDPLWRPINDSDDPCKRRLGDLLNLQVSDDDDLYLQVAGRTGRTGNR